MIKKIKFLTNCLILASLFLQLTSLNVEIVAQVFRHGHRYSVFSFFNNTSIKPGELTESGMTSAYQRGKVFKNKNYGLLADDGETNVEVVKQQIKAYSSKKRRNLVSLFMRIKGMFPNLKIYEKLEMNDTNVGAFLEENFNTEIPSDMMFNVMENLQCREKIQQILSQTKRLDNIKYAAELLIITHHNIFKQYFDSLPENMHPYLKVFYVADYLERYMENETEITHEESKLKDLLANYYKMIVDTTADEPSLIRVFTSRIYSTILQEFEEKVNQKCSHKLMMFSAHDVTMSAFINSIGADVKEFNYDFNDEINFVLYEVDEEYLVSIKYNDQEIPMKFCDNKRICEYEKFKQFLEDSISSQTEILDFCEGKLEKLTHENNENKDDI